MEAPIVSWTQRMDQRARRLNRWLSRHWILAGLLIGALVAVGLFLRWSRFNNLFGDPSGIAPDDLVLLVAIFAVVPLACMFVAWRAGRGLRNRMEEAPTDLEASGEQFDLVAVEGELKFEGDAWTRARSLLVEVVPAERVTLVGDPPRRIRVEAWGLSEVAPDVLTRLEELAGVALRVDTR